MMLALVISVVLLIIGEIALTIRKDKKERKTLACVVDLLWTGVWLTISDLLDERLGISNFLLSVALSLIWALPLYVLERMVARCLRGEPFKKYYIRTENKENGMKTNFFILVAVFVAQLVPQGTWAQDIDDMLSMSQNIPLVSGCYRLDSICTTQKDGTPYGKSLLHYGADGMLTREEHWQYDGRTYQLCLVRETTEYDAATGLPQVSVSSQPDETGQLRQVLMEVVKSYVGQEPEKADLYQWSQDGWRMYGKVHADFDADGKKVAELMDFTAYGVTYRQFTSHEYDSHGSVSRSVSALLRSGHTLYSSETNYENQYDDADNLLEVLAVPEGGETLVSRYYWSGGATTAVPMPVRPSAGADGYFDLQGRHHGGRPSAHGLYIVGGRKVKY